MRRRDFIQVVGVSLVGAPFVAEAQPAIRVYRLGWLRRTTRSQSDSTISILHALRALGYVEDQNLVVEQRYAEGHVDRLPGLARELVALRVDAIVTIGTLATRVAKEVTTTIPIVLFGNFDPVAAGLVASLARPGGNVTGVLIAVGDTLGGKKLELLKEAVPRAARIALLSADDPSFRPQEQELRKAAESLGINLVIVQVRGGDYERAFAAIADERPGALFVGASPYFDHDQQQIIELAAKYRLPAIYEWPDQAVAGGLMGYGTNRHAVVPSFPRLPLEHLDFNIAKNRSISRELFNRIGRLRPVVDLDAAYESRAVKAARLAADRSSVRMVARTTPI